MIRKAIILSLAITCLLFSCRAPQDEAFQVLFQSFQEKMEEEPLLRAFLERQLFFDSLLIIPEASKIEQIRGWSKEQIETLHGFELDRLDMSLHEHYNNLHSFLKIILKNIDEEKIHQTDPDFYKTLPYLKKLLEIKDANQLAKALEKVSLYFQTAITNLKTPTVEKLEANVTESIAGFEFISEEVKTYRESFEMDKSAVKIFSKNLEQAQLSIKDYIAFCNSRLFDDKNQ